MNTHALDNLHPAGQQWIEDRGWTSLTPVQEKAFPLLLDEYPDKNMIITASTGGGKTEPVILSSLTKVMDNPEGKHVRIWYFAPTRALNKNMYERHTVLCQEDYFDLPVTLFQGDASVSCKLRVYDDPDGIVDITPESQEANFQLRPDILRRLIGSSEDGGEEIVIVDEIHEFLGTPRGIHLAFLIHRMSLIWGKPFLFYGMSATIGGGDAAVRMLKDMTGSPENTLVLKVSSKTVYNIKVDCFPEDDKGCEPEEDAPDGEALMFDALLRETEGKNALLFTNSRGMAEEGAFELKRRMDDELQQEHTRTHTSSRTRRDREAIEHALRDGEWDGFHVFATQTLQNGVDFKSVDLVCQIQAPTSVFSLAQRTGRSGRSGGIPTLYLCTRGGWDLVRGIAACNLMVKGAYEAPDMATERWDVVGHQILSIVQEHRGIDSDTLAEIVTGVKGYPYINVTAVMEIVGHFLEEGYLSLDGDKLVIGEKGDRHVCKMDSYTVFPTPVKYEIVHDGRCIGHFETASRPGDGYRFLFAERAWEIRSSDKRKVHVVPAEGGKRLKYYGEGPTYGMEMEQEMKRALLCEESYDYLGESCREPLRELRNSFGKAQTLGSMETPWMVNEAGLLCLFPFCGTRVFNTLRRLLGAVADGYMLKMALTLDEFLCKCRSIVGTPPDLSGQIEQDIKEYGIEPASRLEAILPPKYRARMIATRDYDMDGAIRILSTFIGEHPGSLDEGSREGQAPRKECFPVEKTASSLPSDKNDQKGLSDTHSEKSGFPERILVYVIFQSEGKFREEEKRQYYENIKEGLRWVKAKGSEYGKDFSFVLETIGLEGQGICGLTPKGPYNPGAQDIDVNMLLSHTVTYTDAASLVSHATEDLDCDHVIVISAVNSSGRSVAQRSVGSPLMGGVILYRNELDDFPSGMVAHEVLHLFGAVDLYAPFQSAENEAFIQENYACEVMCQSNYPAVELSMSPITAWTSGFTDDKEEWFRRFNTK